MNYFKALIPAKAEFLKPLVITFSIVALAQFVSKPALAEAVVEQGQCPSVLQYEVEMLESSKLTNLCDYQGKTLIVVNTASGCGFTPQLKGLESVYDQFKNQGLVILGFPSNSFFQESLEGEAIAEFCQLKYGVSFPITAKVAVKGESAHPFFKNLAQVSGQAPQWNFFKYLINTKGEVVKVFPSNVPPDSKEFTAAVADAVQQGQ